jgi:hypothetical protein
MNKQRQCWNYWGVSQAKGFENMTKSMRLVELNGLIYGSQTLEFAF